MKNIEREFEQRLGAFEREANACAIFAYTQFAIHFSAGHDFEIIDRMNMHPGFWNAITGSLQGSAILALGRIFENKPSNHNGAALLRYAETNKGIFQRTAIQARRAADGFTPDQIQIFLANAYDLPADGLAEIRKKFDEQQEFFVQKVAPIRHKIYAHDGKLDHAERQELFANVPLRELEKLVVYPLQMYRALFKLYFDGIKPSLESAPTLITEVLHAAPGKNVSTWEHLHAAKNASEFMAWLKSSPMRSGEAVA